MTDSPVTLTDGSGVVRFEGTQSPSGGSQPGAVRTLRFDFDFTTAAALASGVTVWTPAADDLLLDAWFEQVTAWDQAVLADIGLISAGAWVNTGLFNNIYGPINLEDLSPAGGAGFAMPSSSPYTNVGGQTLPFLGLAGVVIGASNGSFSTTVPLRFLGTPPLQLVANDDGTPSGSETSPAPAAGETILYLKVASPATTP